MPTQNLSTNSKRAFKEADKIISFTNATLIDSYKQALIEIRAVTTSLYETFLTAAEPTKAQLTQFMRNSNIEREIINIMRPYLSANEVLLKDMSVLGLDTGYFNHAWAVDQATGVNLGWGMIDDNAVRAAVGIGGDLGVLSGMLTDHEIKAHTKLMEKAFVNYDIDSQKWISREVRLGIIKGDSVPQLTNRLKNGSLTMSYNSAERIARTEILRSTGIGNQISYDMARDYGVQINETWDATLDGSTRPDHAAADGTVRDNTTGFYNLFGTSFPGPRRSGIASQDIRCRCQSVGEVEGYTPELRQIRGEGLQPYQTFKTWAEKNNLTVNRFGQKYNFT